MDLFETISRNFNRQHFMATLGAQLLHVEPGEVRIACDHAKGLTQQHGYFHAGVMTSIVDSACGYAALTMMPPGSEVLTVEFKSNFMRPGNAQRILAIGKVLKAGKTLTVSEGMVINADNGKELVKMTATLIRIDTNG